MHAFDWTLVFLLNGGIVLSAVLGARKSGSSADWFLGGRSIPWWIVGVSAFATAIDGSDLVADTGGVYSLGVSYFVTNWVGTVTGWLVLAFVVAAPMYRCGMYTNSEFLEARFGPSARVLSSLVQVQYRTMVLANISTTLYLTLRVVGGISALAWIGVLSVAMLSLTYTFIGGSRSVAFTDTAQSVVMVAASLVLFGLVWTAVNGWEGIQSRLAAADISLPAQMTRIGADHIEETTLDHQAADEIRRHLQLGGSYDAERGVWSRRTPAWVVCLSFFLVGMAYSIVNHEQTMRFFAARSLWDVKMAASVAGLLMIGITFFNLTMGVIGRALYPRLEEIPVDAALRGTADTIYPVLVRDFTGVGFKGIVIAGLLAAAMSTYAGIASAMSALLTRDIYARLLKRDGTDAHYVKVGRWLTIAVLVASFAYVPFLLKRGMMAFYLDLVGAFVVPLLTIYLMGALTPVHRASGTIGLLVGVLYGVVRLIATPLTLHTGFALLPPALLNGFYAFPISFALTASAMLVASLTLGWDTGALKKLSAEAVAMELSQQQIESSAVLTQQAQRDDRWPLLCGLLVLGLGIYLSFVVFW